MTTVPIHVRGLRKSYGPVRALRGIDLEVAEGEVFAFLGPNGAGKTTAVEILEGYRGRDGGEVRVLGLDPASGARSLRERIGIVLQSGGMDPYLSVQETVELYRGYYPHPRPLEEVLEVVGLREQRRLRALRLSGGQRRRLEMAMALAGDPDLLFLDEPTTGFDPSARRKAWEAVQNLAALGKTVFLTTHDMAEAQHLAHRVAIVARGLVVAEGSPASLAGGEEVPSVVRFRLPSDGPDLPPTLGALARVSDGIVEMRPPDVTRTLHELTGWALERGVPLDELHVARPTLEDVYLEITAAGEPPEEKE